MREPKITGNLFPQTNGLHDLEDPRSRGAEPDIHDGHETVSATNYLSKHTGREWTVLFGSGSVPSLMFLPFHPVRFACFRVSPKNCVRLSTQPSVIMRRVIC